MKAYRLMCFKTTKIIKHRDVVFMKGSGSIRNYLEMCPSGRNEGPTLMVVDNLWMATSKREVIELQLKTHVKDPQLKTHVKDDVIVKGFGEERRYPTREWRPLKEWRKNHILPQHGEEPANMAIIEDPLIWSEASRHNTDKLMAMLETHYIGLRN